MNTKLYALLLTLLCATGAVQASEGKRPGDNNPTEQPRVVAVKFRTMGSNPLLSLLVAGGSRALRCCSTCSCPACIDRTNETSQSNQDDLARPARDLLEMLLAEATVLSLFGDIGNVDNEMPSSSSAQGSTRSTPQSALRHRSLPSKDSPLNKDKDTQ